MTCVSESHTDMTEIAVGVDPGSRISGVGIIQSTSGRLNHINHYPIRIPETLSQAQKLLFFSEEFQRILDVYEHGTLVIESLFTAKNISSILKLSHIRGVAMMMAAKKGWRVIEYSPATVKLNITGYGRATKEQVQFMVQKILKLEQIPKPADCADALALAICYLTESRVKQKMRSLR